MLIKTVKEREGMQENMINLKAKSRERCRRKQTTIASKDNKEQISRETNAIFPINTPKIREQRKEGQSAPCMIQYIITGLALKFSRIHLDVVYSNLGSRNGGLDYNYFPGPTNRTSVGAINHI